MCSHQNRINLVSYTSAEGHLAVRAIIRKMRGISQSHLVLGSDGHHYVVKFMGNPKGDLSVAADFIGSRLGARLGLPVAETGIIWLDEETLADDQWPTLDQSTTGGLKPVKVQPGPHFYSKLPAEPPLAIYDFLPDSLLEGAGQHFAEALLFDLWRRSTTNRQAVFVRQPETRAFSPVFIDFGGVEWSLGERGPAAWKPIPTAVCSAVYREVLGPRAFARAQMRINQLNDSFLAGLADSLPEQWLTSRQFAVVWASLEKLAADRSRLPEKVRKFCNSHPDLFPRWQSGQASSRKRPHSSPASIPTGVKCGAA